MIKEKQIFILTYQRCIGFRYPNNMRYVDKHYIICNKKDGYAIKKYIIIDTMNKKHIPFDMKFREKRFYKKPGLYYSLYSS